MSDDDSFAARWSRRKTAQRHGVALPEPAAVPPVVAQTPMVQAVESAPAVAEPDPPPTLADAARLTPQADFRRFVAADVQPEVKNAALKRLFTDPHFNQMDGLDTYIGDYNTPDPLPLAMLRQMAQAKFLGLLTEDDEEAPTPPDANPDLQLQPDDAAGRAEPGPGPGEDARRDA